MRTSIELYRRTKKNVYKGQNGREESVEISSEQRKEDKKKNK